MDSPLRSPLARNWIPFLNGLANQEQTESRRAAHEEIERCLLETLFLQVGLELLDGLFAGGGEILR